MKTKDYQHVYVVWRNMKIRCYTSKNKQYPRYGGRGIKICDRWLQSKNFMTDMLPTYKDGLTIERIDNDGDYSPDNCRWATLEEQMRNRCNSSYVKYGDKEYYLKDLAKEQGLLVETVRARISRGWTPEQLINNYRFRNMGIGKRIEL